MLNSQYNVDIASAVGCGLDRLKRDVSDYEINRAIQYYEENKTSFTTSKTPIGKQREKIKIHIENLSFS